MSEVDSWSTFPRTAATSSDEDEEVAPSSPVAAVAVVNGDTPQAAAPSKPPADWICRCTWFMACLVVTGLIALTVLMVQSRSEAGEPKEENVSNSNAMLPPREYYDVLWKHLLEEREVQELRDPSTPTYEALEWMAFQDGLEEQRLDVALMEQRFVMATLFFSTAGAEFWNSQWLQVGVNECDFDGVRCNDEGYVTHLELHQKSLLGQLPSQLSWLTSLQRLDVHHNRLYGTLPPSLFTELTNLDYLDVSFNELTGPLPSDWSSLQQLTDVAAQGNALTGPLPTKLPSRKGRAPTTP